MSKNVEVLIQKNRIDGSHKVDPSTTIRLFQPDSQDGLSVSDIFVREVVQNIFDLSTSVQETTYDVKARFEAIYLNNSHFKRLEALVGKAAVQRLAKYWKAVKDHPSGLHDLIAGKSVPCIVVSDYTAATEHKRKGMWGSIDPKAFNESPDETSVFHDYCLATGYGAESKKQGMGSVGGHGIGKVANAITSKDHLTIVYTYTNEINKNGKPGVHKCIGLGVDEHRDRSDLSEADFSEFGRTTGWLYISTQHSEDGNNPRELRDEDAIELAACFGIEPRKEGDYGTTMCVFNSKVSLNEVIDSYHRFFFPAHYGVNKPPHVTFVDGKSVRNPSFEKYEDLKRVIACYEMALGVREKTSDNDTVTRFYKKPELAPESPGAMAFSNYDDTVEISDCRNMVALIRHFMVVNYYQPPMRINPRRDFAAAYVLGRESPTYMKALAAAEPPKHHVWTPEQARVNEKQKRLIEYINERIVWTYRKYVTELTPTDAYNTRQDKALAKALGKLLFNDKTIGPNPTPPTRLPSEVSIDVEQLSSESDGLYTNFVFKLTASITDNFVPEQHGSFPLEVLLTPQIYPVHTRDRESAPVRLVGDQSFKKRLSEKRQFDGRDDIVELVVECQTTSPTVEIQVSAELIR